ncbi:MAG: hypothetical protein Q8R18_04495 [bacterium]|nr:hypothetical protein [bacterium]
MEKIKQSLEDLLEKRIISGYNIFEKPLERKGYTFILSNLHETEAYLADVKQDLKSLDFKVLLTVRNRATTFRWVYDYIIRDDNGNILKNLRIRKRKEYLDLLKYPGNTLFESGLNKEQCEELIGETKGYDIAIFSNSKEEIVNLVSLFTIRTEKGKSYSWKDAYKTPFILVQGLRGELNNFEEVNLYSIKNNKEFAFISKEKVQLKEFTQEDCYINKSLFQMENKDSESI